MPLKTNISTAAPLGLAQLKTKAHREDTGSQLDRSRSELEAIYDAAPLMICLVTPTLEVEHVNRTMAEFISRPIALDTRLHPGGLLGCVHAVDDRRGCGLGQPCEPCPLRLAVVKTFETGQPCRQVEAELVRLQSGVPRAFHVSASTALVCLQDQPRVLICLEDITHRKELETQLRQAQKMKAVGQLAGGVAHDFNNMLAVIRGNAELLLMNRDHLTAEAVECLGHIVGAAESAANLTRQLLIFSRKQAVQAEPVLLSGLVRNLAKMLKRIIPESIALECVYAEQLPYVQADPGMMEQVLLNLVINACDAMPNGGRLDIVTQKVSLDDACTRTNPEARAGEFACLSVTDTGTGITQENLSRIFDPFFTTKGLGKGTGLGLATVYGIIKQHQGWIEVRSKVGAGTTFNVFLPAVASPTAPDAAQKVEANPPRGSETILVVEDDVSLRLITRRMLESFGYRVHEAACAREAPEVWGKHGGEIALVLSDIVMPEGVTGRDLAAQLRARKPGLKVILMSGYSAESLGKGTEFLQRSGARFLQKPFETKMLLQTVRQSLDER